MICINVLENTLFDDFTHAHSCFLAMDKRYPDYYLMKDFQIHFFELSKIDVKHYNHIQDKLTRWAFFLKNEGLSGKEDEMIELIKDEPVFDKAHKAYRSFTANDELLARYEAREKNMRDERSNLYYARKEGREEGLKEAVLAMNNNGMAPIDIAKMLNLSLSQVNQILKDRT